MAFQTEIEVIKTIKITRGGSMVVNYTFELDSARFIFETLKRYFEEHPEDL